MFAFLRKLADRYNITAVKIQFLLVGSGVVLLAVSTTLSILKVRDEDRDAITDYSAGLLYATQIDFEFSKFLNALDRWEETPNANTRKVEHRRALLQQHRFLLERFPALQYGMTTVWTDADGGIYSALQRLDG